jgi:hypothetical protein
MSLFHKFIEASKNFGWAYGRAFSVAFSQILLLMTNDTELKILLFVAFIVGVLIVYLLSLIFKIYMTDTYLRYKDVIPSEITQVQFMKTIIFDDTTFNDKSSAQTSAYRILKNNMDLEHYTEFRVEITSDSRVPVIGEMEVVIDGEIVNLSGSEVEVEYCQTCKLNGNHCDGSDKNLTMKTKQVSFTVPLDITPSQTKTFKTSYRTNAYKAAIEGRTDSVSLKCNRLTDELLIQVFLKDSMRDQYSLAKPRKLEAERGIVDFTVIDGSAQRMITTERELIRLKRVPYWERDSVIWKVPQPKLGYDYELSFRLEPRATNGSLIGSTCDLIPMDDLPSND